MSPVQFDRGDRKKGMDAQSVESAGTDRRDPKSVPGPQSRPVRRSDWTHASMSQSLDIRNDKQYEDVDWLYI